MTQRLRPDRIEEDQPETFDDAVPTRGYGMVPVVGLGGSAGSVEALQGFLGAMPANTSLAVIVVVHLWREQDSMLAEILQRATAMPVRPAENALQIQPGHVYVIPGGKLLQCVDGHLRLDDLPDDQGRHVTVDVFFRSLADSHGAHSAAVVLSGMDGDGAVGIKRVKERGGLTIAQDPQEAMHDGMPSAAIGTGMVDWVLPVAEMPQRLLSYFGLESNLLLPPERPTGEAPQEGEEAALAEVLGFVRAQTGRNFTGYKRATLLRRVGRRMQLNGVDNLRAYLTCLRTRPGECGALVQDLLISVTNFFRDEQCFVGLREQLPVLFGRKGPNDRLRLWVAACATGEEAYSVAILLNEFAATLQEPPIIQVFASDLDEQAINTARNGFYPSAIAADVSEERLRRYFHKEEGGYRVRRELREMVLFAVHDVLADAPFSAVDLITCRNLLIYLTRESQLRVLQTFHFALRGGGLLMLGTAESIEESNELFTPVDKRHRIFRQVASTASYPSTAPMSHTGRTLSAAPSQLERAPFSPSGALQLMPQLQPVVQPPSTWQGVHVQLLEYLTPSLLVNLAGDILHATPQAAQRLQMPAGARNVGDVFDRSSANRLVEVLLGAAATTSPAELHALTLSADPAQQLAVRVVPLPQPPASIFLVIFADTPTQTAAAQPLPDSAAAWRMGHEFERLKMQLREMAEQYVASTEELKASNEELQAMYEEMRAQAEELQASKEELQSVNEELSTVNEELRSKVDQLSVSHSDMQNLMDATAIAIVFLDRRLCITRFTPAAVRLFHLIATDIGRPLTDLSSSLKYPQLRQDAQQVLDTLAPVEREVGHDSGSWFMVRLTPYRTVDDRIAGVVLTLVDISERKRAEDARLWLSAVVTSTADAIVSFALDQTILSWNGGAERMFGYSAEEAVGNSMLMLAPGHEEEQERLASDVSRGRIIQALETSRRRKDGRELPVGITAAPIRDEAGRVTAVSATMRDNTSARAAAEALRLSEERLRMVVENIGEYAIFSLDLQRRITIWNSGAQRLLGYTEREAVGQAADVIFTPEDRECGMPEAEARTALREGRAADERMHLRKDGTRFRGSGVMMLMRNGAGEAVGFVKVLRDLGLPVPQPGP